MAQLTPARKLFDLLVSRDFDPEMLDMSGKSAADPSQAEVFSFDFRAESGRDYGTVVIMLGDDNSLDVFCADNVGKTMEGDDKNDWFAFLEQLKNFAVKNFMSFSIKNLNRLRYSMQGQAAIKEGLFESWSGRKDVSWNAGATESRLMIKHKRSLGEGEARFRYVESLFIETTDGERYKLPFRNLTAGKAMLEHVRMGGRPYDLRGQHIVEMVNELTVLGRFKRANAGKLLEGDTATLVEQATAYFENLRHNLKSLSTRTGYNTYFESWSPMELTQEEVVIEGLKHLFVTQSIDQRIEDALPVIAKIQQQENAMKEAAIFESWADQLMEGTWQTPDTPEKQRKLIELLSQDLPVGADATNATEQLYNLLGDDELFDQLQELAQRDANADARQVILNRMQELDQDPDVMKVITSLNIDSTAEMNPPEQTPADLDTDQDMKEAVKDPATQTEDPAGTAQPQYPEYQDDLASILKTAGVPAKERPAPDYEDELSEADLDNLISAKQIATAQADLDAQSKAYAQQLATAQANAPKGPLYHPTPDAGIQDFRDPKNAWRIPSTPGTPAAKDMGSVVPANANSLPKPTGSSGGGSIGKDLKGLQQNIAKENAIGQAAGTIAGATLASTVPGSSVVGGIIGDKLGDALTSDDEEELDESGVLSSGDEKKCNMTEAGKSCPQHGMMECGMEESALKGQYGHSGRMKPVEKDVSFLDRLKELSGMMRK